MSVAAARVAIQGEAGSFSHAAARALLGPAVEVACCESFDALFAALEARQVAQAVLPIENSLHARTTTG
jgi:prephenate dehydratase